MRESREQTPSRRRFLGPLGALVLLAGCVVSEPDVHAERSAAESGGEEVAARIGDQEITLEEVEAVVAPQLLSLRQQRHQILEQGLERLIAERLVKMEAVQRGVAEEALLREEVQARIQEVTEAEIDAFYEARKAQIPQPKERVAPQIRQFLERQRQQEAQEAFVDQLKAKYSVSSYLEPLRIEVEAAGFPAKGPADAPITIVEFSDFECPYCSRLLPTLEQVEESYGGKVRLVFRHFPLSNIHPHAQKAAEASMCAHEQGKFWEMHDLLFEEQKALTMDQLKEKAARLGLDGEAFNLCLDSAEYADEVAQDIEAGRRAGVSGTPAMFINGRLVSGAVPFEQVSEVIEEELQRTAAGSGSS